MIKNNFFFIKNLKNVVFIGENDILGKLIEITKKNSLNFDVITSPDQSKFIDKKIKFKVFQKLDRGFQDYIKKRYKIEETMVTKYRNF